jgi:hypothetical protein
MNNFNRVVFGIRGRVLHGPVYGDRYYELQNPGIYMDEFVVYGNDPKWVHGVGEAWIAPVFSERTDHVIHQLCMRGTAICILTVLFVLVQFAFIWVFG